MRGWRVVRIATIHAIFLDLHIFILQRQGQENAVEKGGWGGGLTGTLIDMSSLYLRNEFFFSLELKRHSETTPHYGVSPLDVANV